MWRRARENLVESPGHCRTRSRPERNWNTPRARRPKAPVSAARAAANPREPPPLPAPSWCRDQRESPHGPAARASGPLQFIRQPAFQALRPPPARWGKTKRPGSRLARGLGHRGIHNLDRGFVSRHVSRITQAAPHITIGRKAHSGVSGSGGQRVQPHGNQRPRYRHPIQSVFQSGVAPIAPSAP